MPPAVFRAAEVLDMAIRIENQGIDFYRACLQAFDAADIRKVFSRLIEQERVHREIFAGMKEGLKEIRLPESFPGEYESHLEAFVRGEVFDSAGAAAEKTRSLQNASSAVDWAMRFERDSIAFYQRIRDSVRASEGNAIDRIIGEERRHIENLRKLRRELEAGA